MIRLFTLFALIAATTAFTSPQPWGRLSTQRFAVDESTPPALQTIDETVPPEPISVPKNVVKDLNTGELREVAWQDDAMMANSSFTMSW